VDYQQIEAQALETLQQTVPEVTEWQRAWTNNARSEIQKRRRWSWQRRVFPVDPLVGHDFILPANTRRILLPADFIEEYDSRFGLYFEDTSGTMVPIPLVERQVAQTNYDPSDSASDPDIWVKLQGLPYFVQPVGADALPTVWVIYNAPAKRLNFYTFLTDLVDPTTLGFAAGQKLTYLFANGNVRITQVVSVDSSNVFVTGWTPVDSNFQSVAGDQIVAEDASKLMRQRWIEIYPFVTADLSLQLDAYFKLPELADGDATGVSDPISDMDWLLVRNSLCREACIALSRFETAARFVAVFEQKLLTAMNDDKLNDLPDDIGLVPQPGPYNRRDRRRFQNSATYPWWGRGGW
jgi:hypothetical protein